LNSLVTSNNIFLVVVQAYRVCNYQIREQSSKNPYQTEMTCIILYYYCRPKQTKTLLLMQIAVRG
jgi:hypothetical protein